MYIAVILKQDLVAWLWLPITASEREAIEDNRVPEALTLWPQPAQRWVSGRESPERRWQKEKVCREALNSKTTPQTQSQIHRWGGGRLLKSATSSLWIWLCAWGVVFEFNFAQRWDSMRKNTLEGRMEGGREQGRRADRNEGGRDGEKTRPFPSQPFPSSFLSFLTPPHRTHITGKECNMHCYAFWKR